MKVQPDTVDVATISFMRTEVPDQLSPIFTHATARRCGITDRDLYRWRDEGRFEQIARGIFAEPDLPADPNLIEIAIRAADATLCLATALARHGLIDDIPATINAALPRSRRTPRTTSPITWHRFDEETFEIDRGELTVYGELTIGIYGPARSIIDAFRLRHLYGEDQAIEALRRWLAQPGNQPAELLALVRHFPTAETPLRHVLRVLL